MRFPGLLPGVASGGQGSGRVGSVLKWLSRARGVSDEPSHGRRRSRRPCDPMPLSGVPQVMKNDGTAWVLLADAVQARLLECSVVPPGRCHAKQRAALENGHPEPERGRPSPLVARGRPAYGSGGQENEEAEKHERFARELTRWMQEQLERHGIDRVHLFASPRFLGTLRRSLPGGLADRIEEHATNLIKRETPSVVAHPEVRRLLRPPMVKAR